MAHYIADRGPDPLSNSISTRVWDRAGFGHALVQPESLRCQLEDALNDNAKLSRMLGKGELGRAFPTIFGKHEDGGIVGRPQHGGHEFPVDVHTLHVLTNVRQHPKFPVLSKRDQTDLLWAALLHDIGKRAGLSDPGHESVSATLGWGVLRLLGYTPQRAERIANLVRRHREMSYEPQGFVSELLTRDADYLDDLATSYRHPFSVLQMRIMNESDIRAIDTKSRFWRTEVMTELDAITKLVSTRSRFLRRAHVPILHSRVEPGFALRLTTTAFSYMARIIDIQDESTWRNVGIFEGPGASIGARFVSNRSLANQFKNPIAALILEGPAEQTLTGWTCENSSERRGTWNDHIGHARAILHCHKSIDLITTIDNELKEHFGPTAVTLEDARTSLSQFDDTSELSEGTSSNEPTRIAHKLIVDCLTKDETLLDSRTRWTLSSPAISAIALVRAGRCLAFEGLTSEADIRQIFGNAEIPEWFKLSPHTVPGETFRVPKLIWQTAKALNVPIVVLDP